PFFPPLSQRLPSSPPFPYTTLFRSPGSFTRLHSPLSLRALPRPSRVLPRSWLRMTSAAHDVSSESPQRATAWVSVRRWEAINDWSPGPLGGAGSYGLFLRGEEAARVVSIAWPGARPVQEGARGVQR